MKYVPIETFLALAYLVEDLATEGKSVGLSWKLSRFINKIRTGYAQGESLELTEDGGIRIPECDYCGGFGYIFRGTIDESFDPVQMRKEPCPKCGGGPR